MICFAGLVRLVPLACIVSLPCAGAEGEEREGMGGRLVTAGGQVESCEETRRGRSTPVPTCRARCTAMPGAPLLRPSICYVIRSPPLSTVPVSCRVTLRPLPRPPTGWPWKHFFMAQLRLHSLLPQEERVKNKWLHCVSIYIFFVFH